MGNRFIILEGGGKVQDDDGAYQLGDTYPFLGGRKVIGIEHPAVTEWLIPRCPQCDNPAIQRDGMLAFDPEARIWKVVEPLDSYGCRECGELFTEPQWGSS